MASRTPLYEWHRKAGARFIEFAAWEMPLQYAGIVEEHLAVRKSVGLFDVSHMGKIFIEGRESLALQGPRAPDLLQRFTSVDLSKVKSFSGAVLDFVPPAPWGAAPRAVPPEIEGWGSRTAMDPSMPPRREPSVSDGRTAFLATR